MRKISGIFFTLLFLVVFILSFTTCQSLKSAIKEPKVTLRSVDLADLTFTGAQLLCKVNVENPNAVEIPFPEIDWHLFLNANSFIKGTIKNGQPIKARNSTVVEVPVKFNYLDVYNTYSSLRGSNQADYKVDLAAKFNLPVLGTKVWNLSRNGTLPLLKVPAISFKSITLKNLSLSRIDFELAWDVDNSNSFAMNVKDFTYNFTVNNSQWAGGNVTGAPRIAANGKTTVPFAFSINGASMIRDITDIINRGSSISFGSAGNIRLGADMQGIPDYTMPFNLTGNTRIAR
jgi:LEA14-like dessication related protein